VTADNRDLFLMMTRRLHPIVDAVSDVRAVYTTSASSTTDFMGQVLSEVDALRLADPDAAGVQYYGIVGGNRGGIGYIGSPSAVGRGDLPYGARTVAHELGHNWGRQHAPCGGPAGPDPSYPYPGGTNGVYGYDFETSTV